MEVVSMIIDIILIVMLAIFLVTDTIAIKMVNRLRDKCSELEENFVIYVAMQQLKASGKKVKKVETSFDGGFVELAAAIEDEVKKIEDEVKKAKEESKKKGDK